MQKIILDFEKFELNKARTLLVLAIQECNQQNYDTTRALLGVLLDITEKQSKRFDKSEVA